MTPVARAQYLQQMGIIAYVPRTEKSASVGAGTSQFKTGTSFSPASHSPVKLLFLVQSAALDWNTPDFQLLKKIMTAVGIPAESMTVCFDQSFPIVLPELSSEAKIVAFGSNLTVSLPKGSVVTLSLGELQHNDSAKRQLWQELKAIKAAYGH